MDILRGCLEVLINEVPYTDALIHMPMKKFCTYATRIFPQYSGNEIEYIYHSTIGKNNTVFDLISRCAISFLEFQNGNFFCRENEGLRWRSLYFKLGQDMFTTNLYTKQNVTTPVFFWKPVIDINDPAVIKLAGREIADNHFHLWGSTQIFPLSFSCLMNNISRRYRDFRMLSSYFYTHINYTTKGEQEKSLYSQCAIAAAIRLFLFAKLSGNGSFLNSFKIDFDHIYSLEPDKFPELNRAIDLFKNICGKKQFGKYLDYAYTKNMADNDCAVLAGERNFLYLCFKGLSDDTLSEKEKRYFYSYLIIKNKFRNELIQTNNRVGFKNFSDYQDRKEIFIDGYKQYEREALRLAVNENFADGFLNSIEARICPKKTSLKNRIEIKRIDNLVRLRQPGITNEQFNYVLHFPKKADKFPTDKNGQLLDGIPRNQEMRWEVFRKSRSIYAMLTLHSYMRQRVLGIDACSNEIGCRPEVFAPSFRYLMRANVGRFAPLNATYHVGEDFLDISDGLRAIDEVLLFLGFGARNRLGHALALGIDAHEYYCFKNNTLIMTKHDAIDNIAWIIGKTEDFKINFDQLLYERLMSEYVELVEQVYGRRIDVSVYYKSWKLRGDDPHLYRPSGWCGNSVISGFPEICSINYQKNNCVSDIDRNIAGNIYYRYHFDSMVKARGDEKYIFKVKLDNCYINLIKSLQDKMIEEIKKLGICIEANPSSNILIGSFDRYEKHPIFRFTNVYSTVGSSICASINTDDLGVFDTTLQNEYALLATAMRKNPNKYGNVLIESYIERLRENSAYQKFT